MDFIKKHKSELLVSLFFLLMIAYLIIMRGQFDILSDHESFETFVKGFGPFAPLVIILVIIAEVVFAPVPGFIPALTAGFLFGPLEGAIYAFIGNIIGSSIAFYFARKWGKKFSLKFVDEEKLQRYESAIQKHENLYLLSYFIPILPLDIISFAFGLSKVTFSKFLLYIAGGYTVYVLLLAYFGDYLSKLYF